MNGNITSSNNTNDYRKTIQIALFFVLFLNSILFEKSIWISVAIILAGVGLHAFNLKDMPKKKRLGASVPILLGLGMVLFIFLSYKRPL